MSKTPALGKDVIYVARKYDQNLSYHPAKITRIFEGVISLTVFFHDDEAHLSNVPYSDKKTIGTWHWAEEDQ